MIQPVFTGSITNQYMDQPNLGDPSGSKYISNFFSSFNPRALLESYVTSQLQLSYLCSPPAPVHSSITSSSFFLLRPLPFLPQLYHHTSELTGPIPIHPWTSTGPITKIGNVVQNHHSNFPMLLHFPFTCFFSPYSHYTKDSLLPCLADSKCDMYSLLCLFFTNI